MIKTTNEDDDYDDYEDEVHGCTLTIDAPNLVVLNCCIEMPLAIIVGRLPCMETANINLKSHDRDEYYGHIMCELLKGVGETKVLRLSNSSIEDTCWIGRNQLVDSKNISSGHIHWSR
ncbi:hypothetical protein QJS10_CPA09g00879 [Acorus calamus]|uniref:Uncharacterized protein n=1 Tax=Acorus calamus TaxID=4465 RepID=A0AAV9E857_ACOCL|nr:hypothetical protein QJS10_CPA09g00879 [Acorus calamus]